MAILAYLFFQMYFIILSSSTQKNESKNLGGIFIEFLFHRFNSRQMSRHFGTPSPVAPMCSRCLSVPSSFLSLSPWVPLLPGSPALLTPLPCHWCSTCNFPVGPLASTHPWYSFLLSCLGHLHSMFMASATPNDLQICIFSPGVCTASISWLHSNVMFTSLSSSFSEPFVSPWWTLLFIPVPMRLTLDSFLSASLHTPLVPQFCLLDNIPHLSAHSSTPCHHLTSCLRVSPFHLAL